MPSLFISLEGNSRVLTHSFLVFSFHFKKVERQFEQALKEKKGFVIKKMAQDGACLFRAVGT